MIDKTMSPYENIELLLCSLSHFSAMIRTHLRFLQVTSNFYTSGNLIPLYETASTMLYHGDRCFETLELNTTGQSFSVT